MMSSIFRTTFFLLLLWNFSNCSSVLAQSKYKKLVWSDEFTNTGLPDSKKWNYDKGRGCPDNCGWGNNELQFYTHDRLENARVENGKLIIEAHKENFEDAKYTSARLASKNKGDWKYGRIEVKAKLPAGTGMWPAIWMLPEDSHYGSWAASGEIDILEAVNLGAMKVRSGFEDLVVVGGVESMSRVPMGSDGGAWAMDPQTNLHTHFTPQGVGADLIATLEGFSREDVDRFALQSQLKAARARADGSFSKSLVPVQDQNGIVLLDHDEFIRADSTLEGLGKLKPSFEMIGQMGFDATALRVYSHVERINHVHTPGNSSGIVDGAALMLIGSEAKGRELGLQPRARIVATAVTSTDPTIMLTGPAPATRKALAKAGLSVEDIDLFEVNEAFASVPLAWLREFGVDPARLNVNGGAIALGHPIGATGSILIGTVVDELERRGGRDDHGRFGRGLDSRRSGR